MLRTAGLTTTSPRLACAELLLSLHVLGIGHLPKPVVVQGRRNKSSHMKKEKCVAEEGNKALMPQSLKINSYARLKS